jgi:hypothetical protein
MRAHTWGYICLLDLCFLPLDTPIAPQLHPKQEKRLWLMT